MRILYIADGRSPIALNWIRHFAEGDHQVHLVSTFPCSPDLPLESIHVLPVALGEMAGKLEGRGTRSGRGLLRSLVPVGIRTAVRQWLGPRTLPRAAQKLTRIAAEIDPDLIHAMRIPFEGMLAAHAHIKPPLLVSVWGNDFTLHAPSRPLMRRYTRMTMQRASALHTDCRRDLRLAEEWGFPQGKASIVLPGGGGVHSGLFHPGEDDERLSGTRQEELEYVINPRGFRPYVCNDTFFKALPMVVSRRPQTRFLCPAMAEEAKARRWVRELGLEAEVELLPRQSREGMAALFRQSLVVVSPSTHDGTPNTLLEAMASGCFPIVGDIESLREWIQPGVNGFLVNPRDPFALGQAILRGLEQPALRMQARAHNLDMIAERAEYDIVMEKAERFYTNIASESSLR
jgi:glycosyltransferase involved in cell wall biosynthesis